MIDETKSSVTDSSAVDIYAASKAASAHTYCFNDFNLQFVYIFSGYGIPKVPMNIKVLPNNAVSVLNLETGESLYDTLDNIILNELKAIGPKIPKDNSYDKLWNKLISQAFKELRMYLSDEELAKTVVGLKKKIAGDIYCQIMLPGHFYIIVN